MNISTYSLFILFNLQPQLEQEEKTKFIKLILIYLNTKAFSAENGCLFYTAF